MKTFFDLLKKIEKDLVKENFFALVENGHFTKISYKSFLEYVYDLSSFLNFTGFKKETKAVIMLPSSPTWLIADLAIIRSGGICVPMFSNLSFENMLYQFENSEAEDIFLDDETTFDIIKKTGYKFKKVFTVKKFSKEFIERNPEFTIISIDEAIKEGALKRDVTLASLKQIEDGAKPEDLATIIYTSGTSGRPKGVELTHNNLVSQVVSIDLGYDGVLNKNEDIAFSFLPLAHIFQRTVSYYFISKCVTSYFSNDIKTIADDVEKIKPAAMTVVPRFLEKVKNGINEKVKNEPSFIKKFIAKLCYNYATTHEPAEGHNKLLYAIYDKLMYSKIRLKLGGKLKAMICGGAALPDEVYRFFINIGFPLYQGYGLTETSPVVTMNTPKENKIYTIGRALKGVDVKLTEDRELLVRGPNVMRGYHKMDSTGARAIDEQGFLHTGDLAEIGEDGYIKIIGRKKEQFKTSNGKFINPIKIESMLNAIPFIETSCVIAENKPFVVVILFPNEAGVEKFNEVEASIPAYIRQINEQLDRHEHIHYFYLHNKPASIEAGQITPSMKVIRTAIANQFKNVIEEFYTKSH